MTLLLHFLGVFNVIFGQAWQKRYILLLWLSLIVMLPFDMTVLDSGGDESDVRRIIKLCYVSPDSIPMFDFS